MSVLQVSLYGTGAVLLPFLGELQRFNTTSHPVALPKGLLASRGSLTFTRAGLHLHRTAFGAVQVSPVSKR